MTILQYLVGSNAVWDFLCWECILYVVNNPRAPPLIQQVAYAHTGWWRCAKYQQNKAASVLMAWLVLAFGVMRMAWALDASCQLCAVISYLLEFGLVITEVVCNRMIWDKPTQITVVSCAGLGLLVACPTAHFQNFF